MTFFEKFDPSTETAAIDPYLANIVENLNNILNTKKKYGSFITDLGIDDLNEFRSQEDMVAIVIQEVKKSIEQYEPRVELLGIEPQKNDSSFVLSFKIDCMVRRNSESLHLVFDTLFNKFLVKDFDE